MQYARAKKTFTLSLVALLLTLDAGAHAAEGDGSICGRALVAARMHVARSDTRRLTRCALAALESESPATTAACASLAAHAGSDFTTARYRNRVERRCAKLLPEWLPATCPGPGPETGLALEGGADVARCAVGGAHCLAYEATVAWFPELTTLLEAHQLRASPRARGRNEETFSFLDCAQVPSTTTTLPGSSTTLPEPTTTLPAPTTTLPAPTTTVPAPTTTLPSATTTLPTPTTTTVEPTTTVPAPTTTTVPAPTTTLPALTTTTMPAPTTTVPAPTTTTMPAVTTTVPAATTTLPQATTTTLPPTTTTLPLSTTTSLPPSTSTTLPALPMLVVSEIMSNPAVQADTVGEYVEIHNAGAQAVDLLGLVVRDDGSDVFTITASVVVAPGAFAVLGKSATAGAGAVDFVYGSGMTLANTSDAVVLEMDGIEIDRAAYGAGYPLVAGRSTELRATALDPTANDTAAAWCASATPLGNGDFGSPRAQGSCAP